MPKLTAFLIFLVSLLAGALLVFWWLNRRAIEQAIQHKDAIGAAGDAAEKIQDIVTDAKTIYTDLRK